MQGNKFSPQSLNCLLKKKKKIDANRGFFFLSIETWIDTSDIRDADF